MSHGAIPRRPLQESNNDLGALTRTCRDSRYIRHNPAPAKKTPFANPPPFPPHFKKTPAKIDLCRCRRRGPLILCLKNHVTMNQQQIEQYLQQLRNMGLTEDAIALYRQQMEQALQFTANWGNQVNQFASMFGQQNQPPAVSAPRLNEASTLTAEEQWAVACGADVAFANGQYLNDLATGLDKSTCRQLLSDWWDIDGTEELRERIAILKESGSRVEYDIIWQALNTVSIKESKAFLRQYVADTGLDEESVMEHLRNTRDALELFAEKQLLEPGLQPEMLIWDFARIINLSRGGFDAGYLGREEAMEHIMFCVPAIRRVYTSWKHLSVSYQFARCVWNGVDEDDAEEFLRNMDTLLTDPKSPWVALPWK